MQIFNFDTVDSTNAQCRRMVQEGDCQEKLIVSQKQTAGRGTKGHHWDSEPGGLYCTWYLGPAADLVEEAWISVYGALGVQDFFAAQNIPTVLKWPNDILLDGRKMGGLLAERFIEQGKSHLMLGIGINFLQPNSSFQDKEYQATSVLAATAKILTPKEQVEPILACIRKRKSECEKNKITCMQDFLAQVVVGKGEAEKTLRRMYETSS